MYEPNIDPSTGLEIPNTIRRTSDNMVIEFDITVPEYAEYLQWSAEQNPMPAYIPEQPTLNPMTFPEGYNPK